MEKSPEELQKIVRAGVKVVSPENMVIEFHFNTKISHILATWSRFVDQPNFDEGFGKWAGLTSDFVACLPKRVVKDGKTDLLVDPFAGIKTAFPSNKQLPASQIPNLVEQMYEASKAFDPTQFNQDHRNLVELSTMSGFLAVEAEREFIKKVFNLDKTTDEVLQDYEAELEGSEMLGEVSKVDLNGGTLFSSRTPKYTVEDDKLSIQGFNGLAEFDLLRNQNSILVLDTGKQGQTSVTNLAEAVHAAVTEHFGKDVKVYEAYTSNLLNSNKSIDEIICKGGRASWSPLASTTALYQAFVSAVNDKYGPNQDTFDIS